VQEKVGKTIVRQMKGSLKIFPVKNERQKKILKKRKKSAFQSKGKTENTLIT
jgi:hypothetical protein